MRVVSINKPDKFDEILFAKAWLTFLENKPFNGEFDASQSKRLYELAAQYQANGNFEGAANYYCQSIIYNPENIHSYKYLSLILAIIGKEYSKASEFINYIKQKKLYNIDFLEAVAIEIYLAFKSREFEKVETILVRENIATNIETFPLVEILCIACSMSYLYLGELDKSYNWAKRLQKYNDENGIPYLIFGAVFLSKNSIEEAIHNYEKALELSEKLYTGAYMNNTDKEICCSDLTFAYAQIKNFTKSEYYCLKSLKINNKNPHPYLNLSSLYARKSELDRMREYLELGLDLIDKKNSLHDKLTTMILLDDCFTGEARVILLDSLLIKKLISPILYYYAKRFSFGKHIDNQSSIIEAVKQGNIRDAFDELLLKSRDNGTLNNDLIHMLGSYSFLENQQRLGLLNFQDFLLERGKIQYSLINIINSFDKKT